MYGVENNNRVFFAKTGYYNGQEVTVTHRDPKSGQVWLDDYKFGKDSMDYGMWVDEDSVTYKGEDHASNKRRSRKDVKKTGR